MRCLLLLFAAGLWPCVARAADPTWYVNTMFYSFHEHTTETELHNTTPGVGLIRRQDDWLAGVGVFRNSIGRWAGYGYVGWQYPIAQFTPGPVRLGAIAGLTHHYFWNNGGIVPLGAIVLTVPIAQPVTLDLAAIPKIKGATYATLNLSLSWRFK